MKKRLLSAFLVACSVMILFSFVDSEDYREKLSENYLLAVISTIAYCDSLEVSLKKNHPKEIEEAYLNLRKHYKKCEPWLLYLDPKLVQLELNGPPISRLEENSPNPLTLEPKGLQCIDELLFQEKYLPIEELIKLIDEFKQSITVAKSEINLGDISQRMVFEMYKINLIKIMSMEQTGFESPGSNLGVLDSYYTLITISEDLTNCLKPLKIKKELLQEFNSLSEQTLVYLNENKSNFNNFNRLKFTKEYLLPLYRLATIVQKSTGIEFYEEISNQELAFKTTAQEIFSDEFLNKSFFSGVNSGQVNKINLGRKLFNDKNLSKNNAISCATCHDSKKGFADQLPTANGVNGKSLSRNTPTLLNSVYASEYFWDLRANQMRDQIEHVVFSPDEFNSNYTFIEKAINTKEYQSLFNAAYGPSAEINKNNLSDALVAYVQSLSSWNSEFDLYMRNQIDSIPEKVAIGYNLFMGKAQCGTCHFAPSFSGLVPPFFNESESEVLGTLTVFDTLNPQIDADLGRASSTKIKDRNDLFLRSFKTPTVRNSEITFPYMHNGGFKSLQEVLRFYNKGGGVGLGIELPNQSLSSENLNLSTEEMNNIIHFMNYLTDNPFEY